MKVGLSQMRAAAFQDCGDGLQEGQANAEHHNRRLRQRV